MLGPQKPKSEFTGSLKVSATRRTALGLLLGAPLLSACAGVQQSLSQFSNPFSGPEQPTAPAGPAQQPTAIGNGQVKVGLILPMSATGNAGLAAQSMKNAAEMALAEFQNPNIQLLVKDDGGSPQGAQQGAQQAVSEGAEIILGPLFALSVPSVAQVARARNISVIAFSTDSSIASRGV
jgi:ABC-type branched-subunit amino acid transport system substrate-binding protein